MNYYKHDRRAALLVGILSGIIVLIYHLLSGATVGGDLAIYYNAIIDFRTTGTIYQDVTAGEFVYPPSVLIMFYPLTWFPSVDSAYFASIIVNAIFSVLTAHLAVYTIRSVADISLIDITIIYSFFTFSTYPVLNSSLGNINQLLMLLLGIVFLASDHDRKVISSLFFIATVNLKIFPVSLILYYSAIKNKYTHYLYISISAVTTLILSLLLFGYELHIRYVEGLLSGGVKSDFLSTYGPPSVNTAILTLARPIKTIFPWIGKIEYALISVCIFIVLFAVIHHRVADIIDRLSAFLAFLGLTIIIIPPNLVYPILLYYPLVCLLFIMGPGRLRLLLSIGTSLLALMFLPYQLEEAMDVAGVPQITIDLVTNIMGYILAFGTLPLYGIIIIVVSCVFIVNEDR